MLRWLHLRSKSQKTTQICNVYDNLIIALPIFKSFFKILRYIHIRQSSTYTDILKESNSAGGGCTDVYIPNKYIPKNFKETPENWKSNDQVILHVAKKNLGLFFVIWTEVQST